MDEETKNIEVETLAGDMAKVIGDNEGGVIKKIIAEQEMKDIEEEKKSPEYKRNQSYLVIGAILFILAIGAVFSVFVFREKIFTVEVKQSYSPIIFTDKTTFNEISKQDKEQLANSVHNQIITANVKPGAVAAIYLTENNNVIGLRRFLAFIEANLDQKELKYLSDNFMLGAVNIGSPDAKNNKPFILMQMRDLSDIFEPMKDWERKMFYDLHAYFGYEINSNTKYLLEKDFEDGIIQNKNARVLRDQEGKIVMMYIYVENSSLVITNDEVTTTELISRLASAKVKK